MNAPDAPFARAEALARAGRRPEALKAVDEALAADPGDAAALALKGTLLLQTGDRPGALAACEQAVAHDPASVRALGALATVLDALGRRKEALAAYERVLALQPDNLAALVNRGAALTDLRRWTEALASFDQALAIRPDVAQALANRAHCLGELDRHAEALEAADRAIALQPAYAKAWRRRADALLNLERFEEALAAYRTAASHQRSDYDFVGVGLSLKGLERYEEAVAALETAEALNPTGTLALYHRGALRLLLGDFDAGWRDYEARWRHPGFVRQSNGFVTEPIRKRLTLFPEPDDLAGRRILVVAEQGIGDQLMHASLLPDLLAAGAEVTWVCDRRLHGLLGESFPGVPFMDRRDEPDVELDGFDRILASGSLAHAYRRKAADFPGTPFVRPGAAAVQAWSERLGPRRSKLRIGLSWRGGTKRTGRSRRSMALTALAPLLERADCEFVSLQYGDVDADLAEAAAATGVAVRAFPADEIDDFEDLAGLIANLDLVVSVQTALVHLCGAMGRPALAMVPVRPEWRYLAAGASMPWYRSVRILRQERAGDWSPVLAQVGEAVAERATAG